MVRLWLPDRPGALGAVASRIGAVRGDVIGIDILETGGGQAVDELVVRLPKDQLVGLLVSEIEQVDGVQVEFVRPVADAVHDPRLDGLETAAVLAGADTTDDLLQALCSHGGRVLGAEWAAVIDLDAGAVRAGDGPVPSERLAGGVRGRQPGRRQRDRAGRAPTTRSARATPPGRRCRPPAWPWWSGGAARRSGPGSGGRSRRWRGSSTPGFVSSPGFAPD